MNDRATTVGVTGEDAEAVAERLASAGLEVTVGTPDALATPDGPSSDGPPSNGPPSDGTTSDGTPTDGSPSDGAPCEMDFIVAIGETAIGELVAAGTPAPLVPVGCGPGIRGVPRENVDSLAAGMNTGTWELEDHHPYAVTVDDERVGTAVFDLTLITAEAARISEYTVVADGQPVDTARADGVVVATPAGSTEYARRIHAPILGPAAGLVVAWIAPFRADPDRWVVQPASLSLQVERDEAAVDLVVDGRVVRTIGPDATVHLERGNPFPVAVFPASLDRYG